jgi:hypothetical protein
MPSRLPLVLATLLVPTLVVPMGCTRSEPVAGPPATAVPERVPASGTLVTISAANDQVLAELPLGSRDGLEPGAFLRVYDAGDQHLLKGMVQVTEVLGPHRAVARQVTLGDRQNPFKPGDRVREVLDLARLADPAAIERAARDAVAAADRGESLDQGRFALLREQYQKELAAAKERYDRDLASVRSQYEAQLAAADASHALDHQRRSQELRTDLAALKATMLEQVAAGVAAQRRESDARIATLETEKDNLGRQVASLLAQGQEHDQRIATLVDQLAERDRTYAARLRAEVETRELLAAKLAELESRLAGKPTSSMAVLSADPGRGETVLERLTRLTNELAAEQERARGLDAALATTRASLTRAGEANAALTAQVATLTQADGRAQELATRLAATGEKLAAVERQRDTLELGRLEAERQLYDLAARVLRLAGSSPETAALQARLRDVLGDTGKESSQ